jgi:pro-sigmaK processing inhibitor BofA
VLLKAKSPVKKAMLSMLTGVAALGFANLLAGLFSAQVAVNVYTVFIALTLGIPGVVLIIMKNFFI